jgi:site-specific recombinase XerC
LILSCLKGSAQKGWFSLPEKLAAIRQLFDYLVTREIPAGSVRGPKHMVTCGKTPVLSGDEMRQLLDSIDTSELIGLRDRDLLGVILHPKRDDCADAGKGIAQESRQTA